MRLWRTGTITARTRTFSGCDRFEVHTEDGPVRAVAYHAIVGHLRVGERVIMNCAALARGLGTGGVAFVIAPADRLPDDDRESFGHIVKGRYLPTQVMVGAVDEQDSPHHEVFCDPAPLTGVPVVVADLHSAVPAVLAGLRLDRPQARAAYVMSDGAALPAAFSVSAALMREAGLLEGIVTCGQSFGGDLEATSVANGIIAAHRVLNADVVVIAQGPGNVGTGTTYGFSGLDTAWHLAQARMVGAVPIAVARASGADPRARHRGLSHHSTTVLDDALTFPVHLPVPAATEGTPVNSAHEALRTAASARGERHHVVEMPTRGLLDALRASPVKLRTMGRDLDEDPLAFLCAGAAGRYAARLLREAEERAESTQVEGPLPSSRGGKSGGS